jgi:hypothetical protein
MTRATESRFKRAADSHDMRASVSEAGYNLVILIMLVLVSNLLLGVAMQKWSDRIQREKEEELIFRGMQYAEGIRVFQARHGRPPTRLQELIELEPRSMRQLYPNPFDEDGAWGLLMQSQGQGGGQNLVPGQGDQAGGLGDQNDGGLNSRSNGRNPGVGQAGQGPGGRPGRGGRAGRAPTGPGAQNRPGGGSGVVAIPPSKERDTFGQRRQTNTSGPIVGVYAPVESEDGFHVFMNQTDISTWQFRVDMVPMPVIAGGDTPIPRPNSGIFWRPFPPDLQPQNGGVPGQGGQGAQGGPRGQNLTPGSPSPGFNPGLRPVEDGDSGGSRFGSDPKDTPPPRPRRP